MRGEARIYRAYSLDVGKYLNACAEYGRLLSDAKLLFESVQDVDDLRMGEMERLADFIGITKGEFIVDYVY